MIAAKNYLNQIMLNYPVGKVSKISRILSGRNLNYLIKSEQGSFFLRERNPSLTNLDSFFFEDKVISHLLCNGFNTAAIIKTKSDKTFFENRGRFFRLYEFVVGSEYSGPKWQDRAVVRMLLDYHRIMDSFKAPDSPTQDFLAWSKKNLLLLRNKVSKTSYSLLKYELTKASSVIATLKLKLPHTIIHGDVQPSNLKFKNRLAYLFDFDEIRKEARIADLADLLIYFACLDYKRIDQANLLSFIGKCSINMRKLDFLISEYEKERTLSAQEKIALPSYMKQIWLGWLLWTLANVKCDYEKEIKDSLFLLNEIDNLNFS